MYEHTQNVTVFHLKIYYEDRAFIRLKGQKNMTHYRFKSVFWKYQELSQRHLKHPPLNETLN